MLIETVTFGPIYQYVLAEVPSRALVFAACLFGMASFLSWRKLKK